MSLSRAPPPARSRSRSDSSAASSAAERRGAQLARPQQHVRQARMRRKLLHGAAVRGDLARGIERTEPPQQIARAGQRRRGRRIQPAQLFGLGAPHREIQRQRRQVRDADFGRRDRRRDCVRRLRPRADNTRRAPCGPRGPARCSAEAREMRCNSSRFMPLAGSNRLRRSRPGIDDDAHAVDGEAGLGDVGGEHDLAAPGPARAAAPRPVRRAASSPNSGSTSTSYPGRSSMPCTRRISPAPGRNTSMSPSTSASARLMARSTGERRLLAATPAAAACRVPA